MNETIHHLHKSKSDLSKKSSAKGFTLIEAMVVIAIIGILASLSTMGFIERIRRDRLDGAAAMTAEFLSQASMMVKKMNKDHSVKIYADSLAVFSGLDCVDSNHAETEKLTTGVKFGPQTLSSTGLPAGFTLPSSGSLNSGWTGDCINFLRTNMGNSVASKGLLSISHLNDSSVGAAVVKTTSENRFQPYLYRGGKWVRR